MDILKFFYTSNFLTNNLLMNKTECLEYCNENQGFLASFRDAGSIMDLLRNATLNNGLNRYAETNNAHATYMFHVDIGRDYNFYKND